MPRLQRRAGDVHASASSLPSARFLFVAQYLQLVLGLSPLEAGLWTLPLGVGFIVGSMLTRRCSRAGRPAIRDGRRASRSPPPGFAAAHAQVDAASGLAVVVASTVRLLARSRAGVHPRDRPDRRRGAAASGPARPRRSRRPAPSSAARSASRSSAASAPPSTAARSRSRPASRPPPARPRATRSAAPSRPRSRCRPTWPASCCTRGGAFTTALQAAALTSALVAATAAVLATLLLRRVRATAAA